MRKRYVALALAVLIFLIPFAKAQETEESFSVYTDKAEYVVGDTVNIYVKANYIESGQDITVTDVVVYGPFNLTVAEWHNTSIVLLDTATFRYVGTFAVTSPGNYTIRAEGRGCPIILIAIIIILCLIFGHGHVIPEYPVGPLMGVFACLAALVVWGKRKSLKAFVRT